MDGIHMRAAESDKCSEAVKRDEGQLLAEFRAGLLTVNEVRDRQPFIEAVRPLVTGPNVGWTKAQYEALLAIR